MIDNPSALQKLRGGEVDALVRVIGKPIDLFAKIPPNSGLHLVPIPYAKSLSDVYALAEFNAKDYPSMIASQRDGGNDRRAGSAGGVQLAAGQTIASSGEAVNRQAVCQVGQAAKPPFHPKWRDINLAATVPGWKRYSVAEQALREKMNGGGTALERDFQTFMRQTGAVVRTDADRETLFQNFLTWRDRQAGRRKQ